jgi:beta-phosphoglucomutase-like phosphatase (HAD superfamily)
LTELKIEPIVAERPQAVLFDWAGVLVYDAFAILENIDPRHEEYGLSKGTIESAKNIYWIPLSMGEITEEQFWELMNRRIGKGQVPFRTRDDETISVRDYLQHVRERLIGAHKPYPRSFHLVEMYRNQGIPVGLQTNNCKEWLEIWEREYGLSDMFDPIVASCHIGRRKPEPAFYFEAWKMLRDRYDIESMRNVLVYDDQERNVRAAIDAGFSGVLYRP